MTELRLFTNKFAAKIVKDELAVNHFEHLRSVWRIISKEFIEGKNARV